MRYTLKDYQDGAVRDVMRNLTFARDTYHRYGTLSQFSLSATTGAGKTVMAAAVVEALFFGNDEYDIDADPGAIVLWFSDDPSLNEQSRQRIQAAASELDSRLRIVQSNFSEPSFQPGHVYFLNRDKLAKGSRLVKGEPEADPEKPLLFRPRPDDVQSSIYDTITNTIATEGVTLYLILDEAHRGMKTVKDRETIVQRLINGQGTVPPMPVVFGISATVERFDRAMEQAKGRTALPPVEVESDLVQDSGLLKDDIRLSIPTEEGQFDTVLLQRAVEKIIASSASWREYANEQGDSDVVAPLLVVQMADKPDQATLARVRDTIYQAWPALAHDAIANVFGDHDGKTHPALRVGQDVFPYIEPQRVQESSWVRVLLAKSAISQGWDCPRAEVLVSFRPAKDRTHITQLLGRMTRTPLARRIEGNELLNSVDCLLPYFDRKTATEVADMLMQGATGKDIDEDEDTGGGKGRRVLFEPIELIRNPDVAYAVWDKLESLPTVTIPRSGAKPIRRLTALATALSKDSLLDGAVAQAREHLNAVLDGQSVQHQGKVSIARDDVLTMEGEEVRRSALAGVSYSAFSVSADPRAIADYYRTATRILSPGLCSAYVDHLIPEGDDDEGLLEANVTVAALARVPEIVEAIEREADSLARKWLTVTRAARKNLTDERQAEYDRVEGTSLKPERTSLVAPNKAQAETRIRDSNGDESDLPTWRGHLMSTPDGWFPHALNGWETRVLQAEIARTDFLGWYRNPDRASKDSLAIAWSRPTGEWRAMRPDFVFFGTHHDGSVAADVVDPHGHHLSDALPKLRGMADYAEQFGHEFRRIESVAETQGTLRVLDFKKATVRQAIRDADDAEQVYRSAVAVDY